MATYYLDNVSGNDANDGLSELTAKATLPSLVGLVSSGDIIRLKSTGIDYNVPYIGTSATYTLFNALSLFITRYNSDTSNPKIRLIRNTGSGSSAFTSLFGGVSFTEIKFVDIILDINSSNALSGCPDIFRTSASSVSKISDCEISFVNLLTNQFTIGLQPGIVFYKNIKFKSIPNGSCRTGFSTTSSGQKAIIDNCNFEGFLFGSGAFLPQNSKVTNCRFNVTFGGSGIASVASAVPAFFKKCTFIFTQNVSQIFNTDSSILSWFFDSCIFYREGGTGNQFINLSSASPVLVGLSNNVHNFSALYGTPNSGIVEISPNQVITSNPFLSTDPSSADFCKINTSNSDAIDYIIGKAQFGSTNLNIGYDDSGVSSGGALLPVADVKIGVDRGDGNLGTYDGSDRWTDPGVANVRQSTAYKANSLTNNKTGTLDLPAQSDVKTGVQYDNATKTGTYDPITGSWESVAAADLRSGVTKLQNGSSVSGLLNLPAQSDVRQSTSYDNGTKTGTLDLPAIGDVRQGTQFDNTTKTGTLNIDAEANLPIEADVRVGETYGENNDYVGTLNVFAEANLPAESDVRDGTPFGNAQEGTLDLPAQADVRDGTSYDNATKTGTLDINTEANLPAQADVRDNSTYGENLEFTGTLDLPSETNVKGGTSYDNGTKVGTLDIDTEANLPPTTDVREGVVYGEMLDKNGQLDVFAEANLPSPSDVRSGVSFGDAQNGTLNINNEANLPAESEVLTSVQFGENNEFEGNVILPTSDQVKSGISFGSEGSETGTVEELDLNKFTDIPVDKVQKNFNFRYNSETDNRTGTAEVGSLSTDPGEFNVLKNVNYIINGENKTGRYDNGELQQPAGDNIRIKILKEIENTLYRINPATSSIYQNTIKTVSLKSGLRRGLDQEDMPHVQIVADENEYDHKFVLSGNRPKVTMRVRLVVTSPSSWDVLDSESLYEDIRQAFIRDNFSLNGLVMTTKVVGVKQINSETSEKEDDNIQAEISFEFCFIEQITNLN